MDNIKSTSYFVINKGDLKYPCFKVYRLTEFDQNHSKFKQQLDSAEIKFYYDLKPKSLFIKTTSLEQAEQIVKSRLESTTFDWIKFTEDDFRSKGLEGFEDLVDQEKCGLTNWSYCSNDPKTINNTMNQIFKNQFAESIQKLIDIQNLELTLKSYAKIDTFDSTPITLSKGFAEWVITTAGKYLNHDEVYNEKDFHLLKTMLNTPELANLDIKLLEDN